MANKFLTNIELDAGLVDVNGNTGTSGQILSSTGSGVDWIDNSSTATSAEKVSLEVRFEEAVSKGDPVYVSGFHGSNGPVKVSKARSDDSDKMPAFGLADDDYSQNATGHAISLGNLDDIDTSSYSVGDTLYVAPTGGLTDTKPTGSNLIQNVGTVSRSNANNGSIEVTATGRSNDVPNLSTGKIWVGNSNTVESTVVHLDETNGRMGIGTTSPAEELHVVGDSEITGDIYLGRYIFHDGDTNTYMGFPSNDTITFRTSGSDRVRITSTGNVGIGTTSPAQMLHVNGNIRLNSSSQIVYSNRFYGLTNTHMYLLVNSGSNLRIYTGGSESMTVQSSGVVGINDTGANARLQVKESSITTFTGTGSSAQLRLRGGYTSNEYIILGFSSDSNKDIGRMAVKRGGSGSSFHWGVSTNYGNGITNEAMILNHQGRLGINNLTPSYLLDVGGDGRVNGTFTCVTLVQTSQRDQKKDIADIDKRKAKAIPFKEYKYKSSIDGSERKRYGVVAEDIENDYPELVHTGADGVKGINYIDLLVKRVAELEKELEDAESKLGNIEAMNFDSKKNVLQITVGGKTFNFNPAK